MSLAHMCGALVVGIRGEIVHVEADVAEGLVGMTIAGMADTAVNEAKIRAKAAVLNSGLAWPATKRISVSLLPATVPKKGSGLDLSIAVAILAATGQVPADRLGRIPMVGELGLDGAIHGVSGTLPCALAVVRAGHERMIVPVSVAAEAALVTGLDVIPLRSLSHLVAWLRGDEPPADIPPTPSRPSVDGVDLRDVRGQESARLALEIVAAGGHHLSMVGPPGVGKTMLAERLPGLLPPLNRDQSLESTSIRSVAGLLSHGEGLVERAPFEAPHHSASNVSVVGGGAGSVARPGHMSLAHNGVLFLDEAPEFSRGVLEALRQPLEHGWVTVSRAAFSARLPARFLLVMAANPCPCGRAFGKAEMCTCTPMARRRYEQRLSGPIMDRIDVRLQVGPPTLTDLDDGSTESTAQVAQRVAIARERAEARYAESPWFCNAEVPAGYLRRHFPIGHDAEMLLARKVRTGSLSMRGADRVLRIGWTLADLAGSPIPTADHIMMAISLRSEDRLAA